MQDKKVVHKNMEYEIKPKVYYKIILWNKSFIASKEYLIIWIGILQLQPLSKGLIVEF